jgi:bifunctional NMN adenylyltransferase/nudix hydrolase
MTEEASLSKEYTHAVYIGRFQPFHNGHLKVALRGLELADTLVFGIGSSNEPRTTRNPFTYMERVEMIGSGAPLAGNRPIIFIPLEDHPYDDDLWMFEAISKFNECIPVDAKVVLIGHDKDNEGWMESFIELCPGWDFADVGYTESFSGTQIREHFFSDGRIPNVPWTIFKYVSEFSVIPKTSADYIRLCDEHQAIKDFQNSWKDAPYPVIFQTVDAIVQWQDLVLLIKRGKAPGKGLWAVPGGFLEQGERIITGAMRELKEETGLILTELGLRERHRFDHPRRDPRGRFISDAFHFDITDDYPGDTPPEVKGADDAVEAAWVPRSQIRRNQMFADHWHMLNYFIGNLS